MPVASLSAVTLAPGTTAPVVSVTVPVMRDVLVCAVATAAQAIRMAKRQMEARRCGMWDSFPVSAQESLWWLARRSGDL